VHPYTQGLLAAVPKIHHAGATVKGVPRGEMPSPQQPPPGCRFHTRCSLAAAICSAVVPALDTVDEYHTVVCHLWPEARRTRLPPEGVTVSMPARSSRIVETTRVIEQK
jgi:oligopeptide/dipeptide ABC transporter ATP-binding protein